MKTAVRIGDERGIAMVLVVSLIALLSLLGVWMIHESNTAVKITSAHARNEAAFNLADGALQVCLYCLDEAPPEVDYTTELTPKYFTSTPPARIRITGTRLCSYVSTPPNPANMAEEIYFVDYSTSIPDGWTLNKAGYAGRHTIDYLGIGQGTVVSRDANALNRIGEMTQRIK